MSIGTFSSETFLKKYSFLLWLALLSAGFAKYNNKLDAWFAFVKNRNDKKDIFLHLKLSSKIFFSPAAKPTGHRAVRVVVGGDHFEVMTIKARSFFLVEFTFIFPPPSCSPP